MTILEYLASIEIPLGVSEISRELSLNKISVFRILSSLEEAGWVVQEPVSQKYRISANLLMLGLQLISRLELQKAVGHYLHEIAQITGENAALSIRSGIRRIFLMEVPGRYQSKATVSVGDWRPLWLGAAGQAILAFLPPDDIEKVMKQLEDPQSALTLIGREINTRALKKELVKIKEQGYVISVAELSSDGCAVAAPLFGHNQTVIGSLSLRGLLPRFNRELAQKNVLVLIKTANQISQELGVSIEAGQDIV